MEPTFVSWRIRHFLVGKILINARILQDLFHIETLLITINRRAQDIFI